MTYSFKQYGQNCVSSCQYTQIEWLSRPINRLCQQRTVADRPRLSRKWYLPAADSPGGSPSLDGKRASVLEPVFCELSQGRCCGYEPRGGDYSRQTEHGFWHGPES